MSEDIISDLVELDEEARAAVEKAEQQRDTIKASVAKEAADVQVSYMERANHRIECLREQAQKDSEEQIAALEKAFDGVQAHLDETFEKNHSRWVEEIVARCKRTGEAR